MTGWWMARPGTVSFQAAWGKPDPLDRKPTEEDELEADMLFLVDVSGSMYRFQMMDGRLARMLEATMLVMEALEGLEGKYEYAIRGHSGESDGVEFVEFGQPPSNRGERLKVRRDGRALAVL